MQRGPSIYDVAKAAGVAPSTVSRAFSRPGRVNSRTAERVFADDGEVANDETAAFLRDYMTEFRDHVERVLTVLPRP